VTAALALASSADFLKQTVGVMRTVTEGVIVVMVYIKHAHEVTN